MALKSNVTVWIGCLCVILMLLSGCQDGMSEEQRIDALLLIILEGAVFCFLLMTLRQPEFFIFFLLSSVLVIGWNGWLVHWAVLGWINAALLPLMCLIALCGGIK